MDRRTADNTVGRYEIVRELGHGGMAVVHVARQLDLDRLVALKELRALHDPDATLAQRFLRESRLAGSLSHPNIVTVHDYFERDGTPYIAMEYLEPGSLRPYVRGLTLPQAGVVFEGLLAGLRYAEEAGIIHRDLKPENVMVTREGTVKIADFGIAKATSGISETAFKTATGVTVGTPGYMAPEQAMARDVGPWTDLYALGCMAYEIFVGELPFSDSEEALALLLRHLNEPIPSPRSVNPDLDPGISDWIEALLRKAPEERTRSAADAWEGFEEILITRMGPRWRRAGLLPADGLALRARPAPARAVAATTALATPPGGPLPGPYTPPPSGLVPGPYTPPPPGLTPPPARLKPPLVRMTPPPARVASPPAVDTPPTRALAAPPEPVEPAPSPAGPASPPAVDTPPHAGVANPPAVDTPPPAGVANPPASTRARSLRRPSPTSWRRALASRSRRARSRRWTRARARGGRASSPRPPRSRPCSPSRSSRSPKAAHPRARPRRRRPPRRPPPPPRSRRRSSRSPRCRARSTC